MLASSLARANAAFGERIAHGFAGVLHPVGFFIAFRLCAIVVKSDALEELSERFSGLRVEDKVDLLRLFHTFSLGE